MTAAFIVMSGGLRTRYLFFSKHRISKVKRNNLLPLIFSFNLPFSHYMKNNGNMRCTHIKSSKHNNSKHDTYNKNAKNLTCLQYFSADVPVFFYKTIRDELIK